MKSIREFVRVALLSAFVFAALAGCAVMDEIKDAKTAPAPIVKRAPAPKELGALWSEDSMWNHVYTAAAARVTGDIITIRIDDSFKTRIARMSDREIESGDKKEGDRAPAAATDTPPGEMVIRGSIEEVGARGIYRIAAGDVLRMGKWEPYIIVKGRVRDRDIDGNDEVKVADIVDLTLEVSNSAPSKDQAGGSNHVSW